MPCAVKVHVHPFAVCQGAIKNCRGYSGVSNLETGINERKARIGRGRGKGAYGIDKGTQVEENGVKGDNGHGLEGIAVH